jgi:choline dehydrogenase-like flavoprotein
MFERRNRMSNHIDGTTVEDFLHQKFDFVVVGGGTAGLALATRLSENAGITVGVLECGGSARGDDAVDIPGNYGLTFGTKYDWNFTTVPQKGLGGRIVHFPRGKVLGGTSALNFMTWNRPNKEDFDAWRDLGDAGWGWDEIL